ncbi:hypothetical protein CLV63_11742 [Murinocardiopsis flavida]|uniref:DUF3040 family protein n=1 Tax=Murinocardiopsis flavida TaxID=645275 RepID=A0A2P8D6K2_9ACTN|nr:hypothetical protein [Murinocardiopsis flavida]PSK92837.1 hypothetical protein CLV63_11742 [Murinocardiopsis flavida]
MSDDFREDVSAAAASSRSLGPDYDDAVAAGLVDRIGAEIDARIDAKLAQQPRPGLVWKPVHTSLALSALGLMVACGALLVGMVTGAMELAFVVWPPIALSAMVYAVVRDARR